MTCLRRFSVLFVFLAAIICALPCFAEQLVFSREPVPGESFLFSFKRSDESAYSMTVKGAKNPPQRKDTAQISLSGVWKLTGRNESTLLISFCQIVVNGKDRAEKSWQGKTLHLIRHDNGSFEAVFLQNTKKKNMDLNALLDGKSGETAQETSRISSEFYTVLHNLFAGNNDSSPAKIFGPDCNRKKGEKWSPVTQWIQDLLAKQQIHTDNGEWLAEAVFTGTTELQGGKVNEVRYSLISRHIPGCDVKMDACCQFPLAGKPGPYRMAQTSAMVIDSILPEENPVFSGTKFTLIATSTSELSLIPAD